MRLCVLAALAALSTCQPAYAQRAVPCAPLERVLSALAQAHDERPTHEAVTDSGNMLVVLTSPAGTWTLLVARPDGLACVIETGQAWQQARQPEGPKT